LNHTEDLPSLLLHFNYSYPVTSKYPLQNLVVFDRDVERTHRPGALTEISVLHKLSNT
jgi:hypothetical protein